MLTSERLKSFIDANDLFTIDDRILIAVSGGMDSILLAHLLNESGYKFGIAHCNFALRGNDSDLDEELCRDLASNLKVPFFTKSFNTAEYARSQGISIQMAARDLRYEWLEMTRQNGGFQWIATGHHQSDSMETVLLNLVRGTGISGLRGIRPKRDKIVRPLLVASREEIAETVKERKLFYREDKSNSEAKYIRNKIRLEVIPVLREINPSLETTFLSNSRRFRDLELLLEQSVSRIRQEAFTPVGDGKFVIELKNLEDLQPLHTLVYELFKPFGFSETTISDLIRVWQGHSGKMFYSDSHSIVLDRRRLILQQIDNSDAEEAIVLPGDTELHWKEMKFSARIEEAHGFVPKKNPSTAQMDLSLLRFPLKLRSWKHGDELVPLGMQGHKKISDLFTDAKIPRGEKNNIAILEDGSGEIVWVAGLRLCDRYKITAATEKVYIFEQVN